jgi:phospholipid transport system substrate-binding protein
MKGTLTKVRAIALVGMIHFLAALPVNAGTPTDQIRGTVEKVLAILKDPALKSEAAKGERRNRLRKIIYSRFDFTEMAKRSLGSYWRRRTPEEQREFVEIFADLLEGAYVDRIESYNGEKFLYGNEKREKDRAEVDTKIVTKDGREYSINYRLHLVDKKWKVYDVVIEDISLVNNYRSQFNRIMAKSSYEELLRRMKEKQFRAPAKT